MRVRRAASAAVGADERLRAQLPVARGEQPELPERLLSLSRYMRAALHRRGVPIRESDTPIIPIYTHDALNTLTVAKELYDEGVYVNPVLPPAVHPLECLLRTSYMAIHTEALLDEALDIIQSVLVRFGIQ